MTETIAILNGGVFAEGWATASFHPLLARAPGHEGVREFASGTVEMWPDFGAQDVGGAE